MATNKEFIETHPLQISITTKAAKALRKVLVEANIEYPLEWKETKGIKSGNLQYYNFDIYCLTTNFANAYWYFGILYAQKVLPIWQNKKEDGK